VQEDRAVSIQIRAYRDSDLGGLVALHQAVATAGGSVHPVTASDLEEQILAPGFDRRCQLLVADDGEKLVAARDFRVIATGNEPYPLLESSGPIHPEARAGDLGERMIRAAWRQAVDFVQGAGGERAICQCRCTEDDADSQATFRRLGLTVARDNFTMVHANLPSVTPSPLPEGVQLRTYRRGEDEEAWWQAWTEAFSDHWGQMSLRLDFWRWYTQRPTFFPRLSLVAATGPNQAEVAGFCHCRIEGQPGAPTGGRSGMLRWVGVRRAWRRRGLGDALTRAGLIVLREAGAERVFLGVDHGSWTGADRLYERNGFTVAQRNLYFRRELSLAELAAGV
jgi:mycothiol synthase